MLLALTHALAVQGDGTPTSMEACQEFLFVFKDVSRLCMWSLTGREAKPYGGAGRVVDLPSDLTLVSMRCNCDGSKVSQPPHSFSVTAPAVAFSYLHLAFQLPHSLLLVLFCLAGCH